MPKQWHKVIYQEFAPSGSFFTKVSGIKTIKPKFRCLMAISLALSTITPVSGRRDGFEVHI
jgi:hypothetical protein